jgi:hypothetical protein
MPRLRLDPVVLWDLACRQLAAARIWADRIRAGHSPARSLPGRTAARLAAGRDYTKAAFRMMAGQAVAARDTPPGSTRRPGGKARACAAGWTRSATQSARARSHPAHRSEAPAMSVQRRAGMRSLGSPHPVRSQAAWSQPETAGPVPSFRRAASSAEDFLMWAGQPGRSGSAATVARQLRIGGVRAPMVPLADNSMCGATLRALPCGPPCG